ncbi:hypothetical protein FC093_02925 [Ilyomonas limi]|uniref:Uncharacterized protein n=1 Tax=Ilyomonas limi TaxID=2575867 RepID=A0A4U3LA05_9BACT|nr:hypothetical protein [Ilyomonas limi]TKK71980.1 hypothetical protein FC093_02925 [Ilyomonas limi]
MAVLIFQSLLFTGCALYRTSPKYEFKDEFYTVKQRQKRYPIYVHNIGDTVKLYSISKSNTIYKIDTSHYKAAILPITTNKKIESHEFMRNSFDVDFLTIIGKYRPATKGFPNQFNTNLNGAAYAGYRKDIYQINYHQNRMGFYNRHITHYGISLGGFAGAGGTAITEWTTNPLLNKEYDGVVFTKGIGAIIGIDKLNFGLAIGWDNLLDKYKARWIYQHKVWYGITLGLNLN